MFLLIAPLIVVQAHAEIPGITLQEAVEHAVTTPGVDAASAGSEAARASYNQVWPGRLPTVSASGNVIVYPDEETIDPFGTGQPIVLRDQVTSSLQAQVTVPITGQFAVDRRVAAARSGLDAALASEAAARADAELEAADAWFGALQIHAQLRIAAAQAESLGERARVAEAASSAGSLTRNDLLLVRIALAQAKQAVVQLQGARDLSWARLGLATGSGGAPVQPQGEDSSPPRVAPEAEALVKLALTTRPELLSLRSNADAARAGAAAASWARLPAISGMGVYQHQTGQGLFGVPDTAYLGATMSWNVWAWGQAAAGVKAASSQADQLDDQVRALEGGVRLDILARLQALTSAASAWSMGADTVEHATENLAIQERRHETGNATMQEVLDASLTLVRAQSTRASALFDARRAEAALKHAVGADPWRRTLP